MDPAALELDAVKFAKTAVTFDQKGKYNEAVFYYKVSSSTLFDLRSTADVSASSSPLNFIQLNNESLENTLRAERLSCRNTDKRSDATSQRVKPTVSFFV